MSIEIHKEEGLTQIDITDNSLVGITVDELKSEAVKIIEEGEKKLVLNLSNTNYIDSSGIGKLLFLNKKLITSGGRMEIINITESLLDFFETLAIDKIIPIYK